MRDDVNGTVTDTSCNRKPKLSVFRLSHTIHPNAGYTMAQAIAALGLRASSIRREVREKRLRVAKRCGRYFLLGEWLLEWLRAGEVQRG